MEIKLMQEMRHRNIINLLNWFENDRQVTLILEYAHGGDLFNLIKNLKLENKRLSIKTIQHYSYQLLNGIQYIHSLHYCHCDISLDNILLDNEKNLIKLTDFGMAKKYTISQNDIIICDNEYKNNEKNRNKIIQFKGSMIGKNGYNAPEILSNIPYDGRKADTFSAAVCIFTRMLYIYIYIKISHIFFFPHAVIGHLVTSKNVVLIFFHLLYFWCFFV